LLFSSLLFFLHVSAFVAEDADMSDIFVVLIQISCLGSLLLIALFSWKLVSSLDEIETSISELEHRKILKYKTMFNTIQESIMVVDQNNITYFNS